MLHSQTWRAPPARGSKGPAGLAALAALMGSGAPGNASQPKASLLLRTAQPALTAHADHL